MTRPGSRSLVSVPAQPRLVGCRRRARPPASPVSATSKWRAKPLAQCRAGSASRWQRLVAHVCTPYGVLRTQFHVPGNTCAPLCPYAVLLGLTAARTLRARAARIRDAPNPVCMYTSPAPGIRPGQHQPAGRTEAEVAGKVHTRCRVRSTAYGVGITPYCYWLPAGRVCRQALRMARQERHLAVLHCRTSTGYGAIRWPLNAQHRQPLAPRLSRSVASRPPPRGRQQASPSASSQYERGALASGNASVHAHHCP